MKVICAGINKTGTKPISEALRQLGFTVFDAVPQQLLDFLDHWVDVFQNGTQPDVKRVYQNADAVVDIPGNLFWEEILETFPDCKVILSERDEDSWIQSWINQLEMIRAARVGIRAFIAYKLSQTARKLRYVGNSYFTALLGSTNTKSTCVFRKRYRMHNHRVKSIVPPERLLVFNVKQGWKPLCDFLGCEVPTSAFPHENIKGEILTKPVKMKRLRQRVSSEVRKGFLGILSVIVVIIASIVAVCYFSFFELDENLGKHG